MTLIISNGESRRKLADSRGEMAIGSSAEMKLVRKAEEASCYYLSKKL